MKGPRLDRRSFVVTLLLLVPLLVLAENISWLRSWPDTTYVAAVAAAPDGESYAAGEFVGGSTFVSRLDRRGNRIWTRVLTQDPAPSFGSAVIPYDAAATPDELSSSGAAVGRVPTRPSAGFSRTTRSAT